MVSEPRRDPKYWEPLEKQLRREVIPGYAKPQPPEGTGRMEEAARGLKSSTGNLVTQAFEAPAHLAHPLGDRLGTCSEHQDINTDVLDTRDHPFNNNDPDIPTLKTRPKPDVSQEPYQEERFLGATKNAWHPTANLIKPQPFHSRRKIRRTRNRKLFKPSVLWTMENTET